ncbi:hypothetical protein VE03_07412 [Pseudogymnoascus sp. 23342-1-I1]|nr:hypothetical protein VE03_07412 [Pseudogymnoascus sp. 23342-1-I1]
MGTSGYPPGWEADYDGETERWFYTHKPTGVRQYHFPKAGDEVELAAAMSRTKAANETKLKGSNTAVGLKDLATAGVKPCASTPQAPDAASVQQVRPSIFSTREDLSQSPTIKRSVSERATPTSSQPIPNAFRQSFQAAQRTEATTAQQLPSQQTSLAALPPLNTQLHSSSKLPDQVASSAHPLRINTNALNQSGNVSPVQSMSAGPWSYSTSKGAGMSSGSRGAPYFSQGSERIPDSSTPLASDPPVVPPKDVGYDRASAAGRKSLGQTNSHSSSVPNNNADQVISSRLGILYLSDSDKEDVITNLQNLARMYPDVTLSQLVDPHMELPRAKVPDLPSSSQVPSGLEREGGGKHRGAFKSTAPPPAPIISADASFPIAFVAYSREPQQTHRTYTSPLAGPNPSFGAPSPGSPSDYQRRQHSTSNASITSTAIQTQHDRTHSSSFSARRQDSIGTQTYSPQTRSELAQTAWGLKPASATTEGPEMAAGIPARPATTTPIQTSEPVSDSLVTRPSRQHGVTRKPLSSQSPIMNRPFRSLSWQPRDHSPNPQLPSSLVSEVPEEPSTPSRDIAQQELLASGSSKVYSEGSLHPTISESAEVPPQQQPQGNSQIDQKEFDRLNSIIKEQSKQLALLSQQNVQNLQDLQNQQNSSALHQIRQPDPEHQRNPNMPAPPFTRNSVYTQSSLQNAHYPPSYPSVPVSPISRPESLVYSIRDEPRPLTLPEPAFNTGVGEPDDIECISENKSLPIDEFEVNANPGSVGFQHFGSQPDEAPVFQNNAAQDNIEQGLGVDDKEAISHQPVDTTEDMSASAVSVEDRSESRGPNQTDSKRGSWVHAWKHTATEQTPGQSVPQADANVRDRSESPHHEASNVSQSNDQPLPNQQRQRSQPRVELQVQQNYAAEANPASQSQSQSAQSYQTPMVMSQSAAQEISLQTALEAQIQQHFETTVSPQSAVSPPDTALSLYGVSSDSAVSDISTPGLVHKEYFDPISVQHSQVTTIAPRRISKDLSAPASIAEVVSQAQGHARKPPRPKYSIAEEPKDYEEKQVFFPDHAPLKIGSVRNIGQNQVSPDQKPPVPQNTTAVSTGSSPPRPVIIDSSKPFDTAISNLSIQFTPFSRSKDTEAAPKATAPPESKPPADTNINVNKTHTHASRPRVSSWSEMAKPSYPPQPIFTFGMPGEKQDDAAAAESLYDGDGYGDYDDYSDGGPAPPQFITS